MIEVFIIDSSKYTTLQRRRRGRKGKGCDQSVVFLSPSLALANIMSRLLSSLDEVSCAEIKKEILDTDFEILQSVSATHPSQRMVQTKLDSCLS